MSELRELIEDVVKLKDALLIVITFAVGSFFLGYDWKHPEPQGPKESPRTLARDVGIATCKASEVASDFFHDSALILKQDMAEKKSRVFVAESGELHGYDPFTWTLELYPESSMYGLNVRSAYLQRTDVNLGFYHPLRWRRQGGQFPIVVPPSEANEKIFVLLAISGDREIPTDCKRLLKTTVGPPTQ
jgi:hypothetical protein